MLLCKYKKKIAQPVVVLHCVAHNLELGFLDAVKSSPYLETSIKLSDKFSSSTIIHLRKEDP